MIKRDCVAILAAGVAMLGSAVNAQAPPVPTPMSQPAGMPATAVPGTIPSIPVAPVTAGSPGAMPANAGATLPATGVGTADPALGTAVPQLANPALPGVPVAGTSVITAVPPIGGLPGMPATGVVAAPTPPPLGNLDPEAADASASQTTASIAGSAAPSQLYTFLFIEDPEFGVVRHRFNSDVAENIKEQEIQRLVNERRAGQAGGPGAAVLGGFPVAPGAVMDPNLAFAGGDPAMMDPALMGDIGGGGAAGGALNLNSAEAVRAAAEWDFYYDQLEMYDKYVKEKLVPNAQDLPTVGYTADNALQERQDLFESFQEAAITQTNEDFNDNRLFYERLQKREDRRIAYRQWIMHKQNEVAEWAEVWARNVFGTRWADGEEVRVDDWYYGTDFNSAKPVLIAIDDREYVVSRQPVEDLQQGQLNVISSNLTPYDLIDNNGYLKNPVMETLRGTVVIPPVGAIPTASDTVGTIEIIGGDASE